MAAARSTQKVVVAWSQSAVPLWIPTTAVAPSFTLVRATGPRPTCCGESGIRRTATAVRHRTRAPPRQTRPGRFRFGREGRPLLQSQVEDGRAGRNSPDPMTSQM